jgi:hypothetical protein
VWDREPDQQRAAVLADAIRDLQPHPEDWGDQWEGQVPPDWVNTVSLLLVAGLALPFELRREALRHTYNNWLESKILEPLRTRAPEMYIAVVKHIRLLINSVVEGKNE